MPTIANVDLDGDGTTTTPIPGVEFNCFNRGCGEDDLAQARGGVQPAVRRQARRARPGDPAADAAGRLRVRRQLQLAGRPRHQDVRPARHHDKLAVFVEVFNVFNVANLGGYSYNLSNTATFGQPTNRASQVFGSGGPRAFQLGGRFTF